jgi:ABC-type lipoprotein release transport system permease subunit
MNAADVLAMSWGNLTRRKGRTALTLAGVVIGVAALILMVSLGLGLQREVLKVLETEDELRTLHVTRASDDSRKGHGGSFGIFGMMGMQVLPITEKDLQEIRALPGVEKADPNLDEILNVKFEKEGWSKTVPLAPVGAAPAGEEARYAAALVQGRLWGSPGARECLLPRQLVEFRLHLKPEEILGAKVTFGGLPAAGGTPPEPFTCSGVFDADKIGLRGGRKVVLSQASMTDLRAATKGGALYPLPFKADEWMAVTVKLADPQSSDAVSARLKNAGYDVLSASDVIRSVNIIFLIVEGFMACIGAIGLVVSLFGIANTMAMAVLERTREIGIMKALGARNREIGRLFLSEAAAIGAVGGLFGLGIAYTAGKVFNVVARSAFSLPEGTSLFYVSLWLAVGSVGFSMFVSVIAGTLPARRAARMDPVRSLRYE